MSYLNPLAAYVAISLMLMVAWSFYNLPLLLKGVRSKRRSTIIREPKKWPFVTAIIPACDEEAVLTRENNIVESLIKSDYPKDRFEILLAVTAISDNTDEVARAYGRKYPGLVRVVSLPKPEGKPKALNAALKISRGEVVAVFDADGYVTPHTVRNAVATLMSSNAAAVQGRVQSLNSNQSFIAQIVALEEKGWDNTVMEGRDALGLFVPLRGTNFYIRRDIVEKIGDWDEHSLAEDADLSARLHESGYKVIYQPESLLLQESAPKISILIPQRVRWFRGYIETGFKFGRLVKKSTFKALDAEIVLTAPLVMSLSFISYLIWLASLLYPPILPPPLVNPAWLSVILTAVTLFPIGLSIVFKVKPRRMKNLLFIPFIYAYWIVLTAIATYSLLLVLTKRPRKWIRTLKTGYFDKSSVQN